MRPCNRLFVLSTYLSIAFAALDLGFASGDSDLTQFVTRPELKSPRFNVSRYNDHAISPGYWLVAPYIGLHEPESPPNVYQACSTGPHIYDGNGELVWSGACDVNNQVTSDFRTFSLGNAMSLSAILYRSPSDPQGHAILMDSSLAVTKTIHAPPGIFNLDMHGLQIIDDGQTGLQVSHKTKLVDVSSLADRGVVRKSGFVMDAGFREFDVETNRTKFEWWMYDHVPLSHSVEEVRDLDGPAPFGYNPYHVNSVDKDSNGDYLISSRFTDCIYKISGQDGSIIWRLGGVASSFVQENFTFSKQHDARFVESNATTTIISFLDNASSGAEASSPYSSAMFVALDTSATPLTAKVVRRHTRPDGRLTDRRGNVQLLPNDNAFVCWSENSFISEFTSAGEMVMEAQFASRRFMTYRAYKLDFVGQPNEAPALAVSTYGTSTQTGVTVCYVSWNGATEVAAWEFHRATPLRGQPSLIGQIPKTGFETTAQFEGLEFAVFARALSSTGQVLGESKIEMATVPPNDLIVPQRPMQGPKSTVIQQSWSTNMVLKSERYGSILTQWYFLPASLFATGCGITWLLLVRKRTSILLAEDEP